MDMHTAAEHQKFKLCEINEFSYENARIYNKKTKQWHDKHIQQRNFILGQQVLLYNSRLKLFPGKLKSRWSGHFRLIKIYSHAVVDLKDEKTGQEFMVNGQQVKHYIDDVSLDLRDDVGFSDPV